MTPLRVFIGWDDREAIAYHVLAHSVLTRASGPVTIAPLRRELLRDIHSRPRGPLDSTDFSITRFLVPYLSGYEGVSVFMDADMLCLADLPMMVAGLAGNRAVYVCKHDYVPVSERKFCGERQTIYPRKNWSSFMVFDNERCRALAPAYVNSASGLDLHRFAWLGDDEIGSLPLEWNWLVGEYDPNPATKILHYTLGGPWFPETRDCDHADLWIAEARAAGLA